MLLEERQDDVVAVIIGRVGMEEHAAHALPLEGPPPAMCPRTDCDAVENSRIILLNGAVGLEWTFQILLIEPPTDSQHRALHAFHMLRNVARLPEIVVYRIVRLIVEQRTLNRRL